MTKAEAIKYPLAIAYMQDRFSKLEGKRGKKPIWFKLRDYNLSDVLDVAVGQIVETHAHYQKPGRFTIVPIAAVLCKVGHRLIKMMGLPKNDPNRQAVLASVILEALREEGAISYGAFTSRNGKTRRAHTVNYIELDSADLQIASLMRTHPTTECLPQFTIPPVWTGPKREPDKRRLIHNTTPSATLVAGQPGQMPDVYRAVNALQSTAFKINTRVLDVLKQLDAAGIYGVIPEPVEKPDNFHKLPGWRQRGVVSKRAKRQRFDTTMGVVKEVGDRKFYNNYYADYRGRLYASTIGINPQGNDIERSLLVCANPKVMAKGAVKWLRIHLANVAGQDHAHLDDRIQWTIDHEAMIVAVASDPIGTYSLWSTMDKPVAFLAAAMAYRDWLADPENYHCDIFISLDATCSVLQILSALTRDSKCAVETNLSSDNTRRGDFYQLVADALQNDPRHKSLTFNVKEFGDTHNEVVAVTETTSTVFSKRDEAGVAGLTGKDWRAIGKAQTMLPMYSSKEGTVASKIITDLKKGSEYAQKVTWMEALELTKLAYDVLRKEAAGPWSVLNTLMEIGSQASNGLSWTTPTGFPVDLKPRKAKRYRTEVEMEGIKTVSVYVPTEEIRKPKIVSGVTANLIHSLDAALVARVVSRLHREGVNSFLMVHDSFGVTPQHCEKLYIAAREEFVKLIGAFDLPAVIEHLKSQLPQGHKPLVESVVYGDFDVSQVVNSEFFIS